MAKNPRKIGKTTREFIPDVVAAAYTMGGSTALTAGKIATKEVLEETGERLVRETLEAGTEKAGKEALEAGAKRTTAEMLEQLAKHEGGDIAKVVTRKISNRLRYLGRTPGKSSRTGREVFERMRNEIPPTARIGRGGKKEFWDPDNSLWRDVREADMGHIEDAVTWWNREGRIYGPKSKEVRDWMLDSDNYRYEYYRTNRSRGSILGQTTEYLPPL